MERHRPARLGGDLVDALAGREAKTARGDDRGPERAQNPTRFDDRPAETVGAGGELRLRAGWLDQPEILARIDVLLGADDEGGDAVVQLVRDTPPFVLLREDDLLDHPRERLGMALLFPPRFDDHPRRQQDDRDLERVQHDGQRSWRAARRLEHPHLDRLVASHAEKGDDQQGFLDPANPAARDSRSHVRLRQSGRRQAVRGGIIHWRRVLAARYRVMSTRRGQLAEGPERMMRRD